MYSFEDDSDDRNDGDGSNKEQSIDEQKAYGQTNAASIEDLALQRVLDMIQQNDPVIDGSGLNQLPSPDHGDSFKKCDNGCCKKYRQRRRTQEGMGST